MAYGALGGGEFSTQNKVIPGTYINFISAQKINDVMSERGKAAFPVTLSWGGSGIIRVQREDFEKKALPLFGYAFNEPELWEIREVFCHATEIIIGRLNGKGDKAEAAIGDLKVTAKYPGTRGNSIKIIVQNNIDEEDKYDIITYFGIEKVGQETVSSGTELIGNDYVSFQGAASLTVTAGTNLTGGTDSEVTGENYSEFLEALEYESFNTLGYFGTDEVIKKLFDSFIRRMRKSEGIKIQGVLYDYPCDYEGIISVKNTEKLVPWVLGAEAGVSITEDNTNRIYDGELDSIPFSFTFENEKKKGHLLLYKDGTGYRVLDDINTLVTDTPEKSQDDFSSNRVIRTLDQIAIDTAIIFNQNHLGKTPNSVSGRGFFKEDIVKHRKSLQDKQAIEDFMPEDMVVKLGNDKKTVSLEERIKVTDMMKFLYMTVEVE